MTKEELKEKLASKENKLAIKLADLLSSYASSDNTENKPHKREILEEVKRILDLGCPQMFFKRDPVHPRSKYRIMHILDICFDAISNIRNNNSPHKEDLINIFEFLVRSGFEEGTNTFRGNLSTHILNNCFYPITNEKERENQKTCIVLAKILINNGKVNITTYAKGSYLWVNCPKKLQRILDLGANPKGEALIDCAISYIACSPNFQELPTDRIQVVQNLLNLGAVAKRPIEQRVGDKEIKEKLLEHGLLAQIECQIKSNLILELSKK